MKYLILFVLLTSTVHAADTKFESASLEQKLKDAGIPVDGLCYEKRRIDFKAEATPEQRAEAAQIMAAFDPATASVPKSETDKLNDKINTLLAILGVVGTAALGKTAYDKLKSDTEKA